MPLTEKQKNYVRENYKTISAIKMALHLGVNVDSVQYFKKNNKLYASKKMVHMWAAESNRGKTNFTTAEDEYIKANYLTTPIKQLAAQLNRSFTGVAGRIDSMGLELPEKIRAERKRIAMYRKGHIPANKGKKQTEYMTAAAIEKTVATRFKKGERPHNSLPIGTIVIKQERKSKRNYKYQVQPKGRMELYHKVLWEKENGKIPKGYCLWFKDGKTMNVALDNLELISRAENVTRNSIHRYSPEIKKTFRIIGKLNKKIQQWETQSLKD